MNELIEPQGSLLVVKNSKSKEFVASELSVSEAVSDEYEFQVTVLSASSSAEDWIGEPIDCNFYTETGTSRKEVRTFKGYVVKAQVQSQRVDSSYFGVKLTVQPWFFLLKHSRQCRVFQEASVHDRYQHL